MSIKIDSNPNEIDMFLLRAADITSLRNDFEKTCMDIYSIKLDLDPDTVFYDQDLKSFDDLYFRVKLCASKYAHKMADASSTAPANASQTNQARPRLPKIDLFQFDGDIENFTTFHETFCSLVHNQTTISNIDKFHYLLSCTKGSALSIVKSIPITSSNYEVVWQSLLDKYKDNRTLLGIYLDKMLSFPILKSESPANLNNFIETFDHSYRAINALQIDNLPSYLFCHIALRALDANTRKTFEMSIDQKAIPTYEQLMNHIQKQVKVLEHSQSSNTTYSKINNIPNKNAASTNVNQNVNKRSSELNNRRAYVQSSQSTDNYSCLHCGQYHMIFRCPQFRELPPAQRLTRAEHLRLCLNCLKPNHVSANCQSKFKCFFVFYASSHLNPRRV